MTALEEYAHLECPGVWRAGPDAQRRDVSVAIGQSTLVITDQTGRALAHWSLPAVERLNPGMSPAFFAPSDDAGEILELDETMMIEAIEKVRRVIRRRRPHRGRVRALAFATTLAALGGFCVFVLPDVALRHTLSVVPPVKRAEIGQQLMDQMTDLVGGSCRSGDSARTLEQLRQRLTGSQGALYIMRGPMPYSLHLPGGRILLDRRLVEDHDGPEVLAGFVLAERLRLAARDPLERLLSQAGLMATLRLLTTGTVSIEVLRSHARTLVAQAVPEVETPALLAEFAAARVPSSPYAFALDPSGETTIDLIEADPVAPGLASPVIRDTDWVGLQTVCGG